MPPPEYALICSGISVTGTVRANNEDALQLYSLELGERLRPSASETSTRGKGAVMLVCDGMGGAAAGEIASELAVRNTLAALSEQAPERPATDRDGAYAALENALNCAHKAISDEAQENLELTGMGTTLTALWLCEDIAYIAHIGDSRLYHISQEEIRQLSDDQSPVGKLVRGGFLTPEQARQHPDRNLLEQALGAELESISPQIETFCVTQGDIFMLCTDGLSDAMSDSQMHQLIVQKARGSIPTACKYLVNEANTLYGEDNITVALCRVLDGKNLAPTTV